MRAYERLLNYVKVYTTSEMSRRTCHPPAVSLTGKPVGRGTEKDRSSGCAH